MMHARFSPAETDPDAPEQGASWAPFADDAVEARAARRVEIVAELQEICLDVARALGREIIARTEARERARAEKAAEAPAPDAADADADAPDHLALAFSRVTRVLNLTLAQGGRLDRDRPGMAETGARAPRAKPAPIKPAPIKPAPAAAKRNDDDYGSGPMTFDQRQRLYRKLRGTVMQHEVRDLATQAIHAQIRGEAAIEQKLSELEAVLGGRDDSDRFSEHPIGVLAAAVCRRLGLIPDWSLWTQEAAEQGDGLDDDEEDLDGSASGAETRAADDPEAAFTAFGPVRPERARAPP